MVRRLCVWTTIAVACLLFTLLLSGRWLLATRDGNLWLLETLSSTSGGELEVAIEQPLWSGLQLHDLRLAWPQGEIVVAKLELRWRPWRILRGFLDIQTLHIESPLISWQAPQTAPAKAATPGQLWPDTPAWLDLLHLELGKISIDDLRLQPPDAPPLSLPHLNAALSLQDGILQLSHHLEIETDRQLRGNWAAELPRRSLSGELLLSDSAYSLQLHTRLHAANEQLTGNLDARYTESSGYGAELTTDLALDGAHLNLTALKLIRLNGSDQASGSAYLDWQQGPFSAGLNLAVQDLDLAPETGWGTRLAGNLIATFEEQGYRAEIDFVNHGDGWEQLTVTAQLDGDWQGMHIEEIEADWLNGTVNGRLELDWRTALLLSGSLEARHLDPSRLHPQLQGDIALALDGVLSVAGDDTLTADWNLRFPASSLRGYPFSGACQGSWSDADLALHACRFFNGGAKLQLAGRLRRQLEVTFVAPELAGLFPETHGALRGDGWLSYREHRWAGALQGTGDELIFRDLQLRHATFSAAIDEFPTRMHARLLGQDLRVADTVVSEIDFSATGGLAEQTLQLTARWADGDLAAMAVGQREDSGWRAQLQQLETRSEGLGSWQLQQPAEVVMAAASFSLEGFSLRGENGAKLCLDIDRHADNSLRLLADWQALPLAYANPWLAGPQLAGLASGTIRFSLTAERALELAANLDARARLNWRGSRFDLRQITLDTAWDTQGLTASGELLLGERGRLDIEARSPLPGRLAVPAQGELAIRWQELPLNLISPWLPDELRLEGSAQGEIKMALQEDSRFELSGVGRLGDARLLWQENGSAHDVAIEGFSVESDWREEQLHATLQFDLPGFATARAWTRLPVTATLPPVWQQTHPWSGQAHLDFPKLEPLGALWPNLLRRADGQLRVDAEVAGSPAEPRYHGNLALDNASAEFLPAGIELREAVIHARFAGTTLRITRLNAHSGEGFLRGEGAVSFVTPGQSPQVAVTLRGENFSLLSRPDIRLVVSPDLSLSGRPGDLTLAGEVAVERMLINEPALSEAVTPSEDVILLHEESRKGMASLDLLSKLTLKLTLGDHVLVKIKGLDARLGGRLELFKGARNTLAAQGEIRVEDGRYSTYGINLPITRGLLLFSGGPLANPALDVLAEKTFDEVRAGVALGGSVRRPRIRLVSTPEMGDSDILSYLVLGRPMNESSGEDEGSALMLAAGALLSRAESAVLRDRMSNQLGIDKLSIDRGRNVEDTIVTVGKYLTPDIYISYGHGLSDAAGRTQLRYRLNDSWQLESEFGEVSGADLYYRIELP